MAELLAPSSALPEHGVARLISGRRSPPTGTPALRAPCSRRRPDAPAGRFVARVADGSVALPDFAGDPGALQRHAGGDPDAPADLVGALRAHRVALATIVSHLPVALSIRARLALAAIVSHLPIALTLCAHIRVALATIVSHLPIALAIRARLALAAIVSHLPIALAIGAHIRVALAAIVARLPTALAIGARLALPAIVSHLPILAADLPRDHAACDCRAPADRVRDPIDLALPAIVSHIPARGGLPARVGDPAATQ